MSGDLERFRIRTIAPEHEVGLGIGRTNSFCLNSEQWRRIEPYLPTDVSGVDRVDDHC
jgi:hypothetical protein